MFKKFKQIQTERRLFWGIIKMTSKCLLRFLVCSFSRIIHVNFVLMHNTCQDIWTNMYRNRNDKKTFMKPDPAWGWWGEEKETKTYPKPSNLQHTQSNGILSTASLGTWAFTFTTLSPPDGIILLSKIIFALPKKRLAIW